MEAVFGSKSVLREYFKKFHMKYHCVESVCTSQEERTIFVIPTN